MSWKERYEKIKIGDRAFVFRLCTSTCDICRLFLNKVGVVKQMMGDTITLLYDNGEQQNFTKEVIKKQ